MSNNQIPKRVLINNKWYDVREGWAGKLELFEYMKYPEYTANEYGIYKSNLFIVNDTNGNKVGDFHIINRTWSGIVGGFEM